MPDVSQLENEYREALNERATWDTEWRKISDYLLPGRGIYNMYTKPQVRKLTSSKVVNTTGKDALRVATSGLFGALTSPSLAWFDLKLSNLALMQVKPIKEWLDESKKVLYKALADSNFYGTIQSFYTEFVGFGTGAFYHGEDSDNAPFRFEVLTVGEYAIVKNTEGMVDRFFRTIYMTARNAVSMFGDGVSASIKSIADSAPNDFVWINHAVYPEWVDGKPYASVYWEPGQSEALGVTGFHEFPYYVGQFDIIGSDTYGLGLGSEALPDIKSLQEQEKAFLMGAHKGVNPPVNAPARLQGKVTTLPGGVNYYSNPNEMVTPTYGLNFNFDGITMSIDRVEQRIKRIFYNDLFLTASRNPNASPLKATEVLAKENERVLLLGPAIQGILYNVVSPLISRSFNILGRKGLLPPLDPQYAQLLGDYSVVFTSPLANAQKLVALQPINSFLGLLMNAAQIKPDVTDKVKADNLIDEYAELTGVPEIILTDPTEVAQIRQQREMARLQQQQKAEQMAMQRANLENQEIQAGIAKDYSEVGAALQGGNA